MLINHNKSGILIFKDKHNISENEGNILGIPIVKKYAYLGVVINHKLNLDSHYSKLKKKIRFIRYKLHYVFNKNSLKFRLNCFQIFIAPLFSHINGILFYSRATDKERFMRLWRTTLKSFIGLKKNCNNSFLKEFYPYDFISRMHLNFRREKQNLRNRMNFLLNEEIINKQLILCQAVDITPSKISLNAFSKITTILNLIGKKISPTRRFRISDLTGYFDAPVLQVVSHCIRPTPGDPIVFCARKLIDTLNAGGVLGLCRLITPLEANIDSSDEINLAITNRAQNHTEPH